MWKESSSPGQMSQVRTSFFEGMLPLGSCPSVPSPCDAAACFLCLQFAYLFRLRCWSTRVKCPIGTFLLGTRGKRCPRVVSKTRDPVQGPGNGAGACLLPSHLGTKAKDVATLFPSQLLHQLSLAALPSFQRYNLATASFPFKGQSVFFIHHLKENMAFNTPTSIFIAL